MMEQEEILEDVISNMDGSALSPRIDVGIDEFTIVLQPTPRVPIDMWAFEAQNIIHEFISLSKIEELFGELEVTHKLVQGYNSGFTLNRPFYFCICFNSELEAMGVCCRFSAYAWASYQEEFYKTFDEGIDLAQFLRMVQSDIYSQRVSRVDLTADFFNMPNPIYEGQHLSPDTVYNCLMRGQMAVVDHKGASNIKKFSAINNQGEYETCYVGSRKGNTSGFLRIYDKKKEQEETHGFRYADAIESQSWVRFEAVYKSPYSHQIGDALLDIYKKSDYECFIASKILDKYIFKLSATNETAYFSELLMMVASGKEFESLECKSPRDNELMESLKYLVTNSGLYITLEKVRRLYNPQQQAVEKVLKWLYEMFNEHYQEKLARTKNHEVDKWLTKHRETTQDQSLDDILESVEMEMIDEGKWYS